VNGIIDWEDATLGDPALDFVGLLYMGGWEPVEEVLSAYEGTVDDTFRQRMSFYLGAIPFHQIRFGLETKDDNHVQDGLDTLYRLL
jgi:aminoglycoside 2''-phosphotransferase